MQSHLLSLCCEGFSDASHYLPRGTKVHNAMNHTHNCTRLYAVSKTEIRRLEKTTLFQHINTEGICKLNNAIVYIENDIIDKN